jgi:hypothetical protein
MLIDVAIPGVYTANAAFRVGLSRVRLVDKQEIENPAR